MPRPATTAMVAIMIYVTNRATTALRLFPDGTFPVFGLASIMSLQSPKSSAARQILEKHESSDLGSQTSHLWESWVQAERLACRARGSCVRIVGADCTESKAHRKSVKSGCRHETKTHAISLFPRLVSELLERGSAALVKA